MASHHHLHPNSQLHNHSSSALLRRTSPFVCIGAYFRNSHRWILKFVQVLQSPYARPHDNDNLHVFCHYGSPLHSSFRHAHKPNKAVEIPTLASGSGLTLPQRHFHQIITKRRRMPHIPKLRRTNTINRAFIQLPPIT